MLLRELRHCATIAPREHRYAPATPPYGRLTAQQGRLVRQKGARPAGISRFCRLLNILRSINFLLSTFKTWFIFARLLS